MNSRRIFRDKQRDPYDRRRDAVTEVKVEVAVLFEKVFSTSASQQFMLLTDIPPHIRERVRQKRYRHRFFL